jgi:hypothetical protein
MKGDVAKEQRASSEAELLILPNGQVLVHNLTAMVAEALVDLNPDDEFIRRRVLAKRSGHSAAKAKQRPGNVTRGPLP